MTTTIPFHGTHSQMATEEGAIQLHRSAELQNYCTVEVSLVKL